MRTASKLLLLWLSSAAVTLAAAPPSPLPIVPDAAQERVQTQLALQQAQAQASVAATQARVQAQLDAHQARLQAQLAAEEAGTPQLPAPAQGIATAPPLATLLAPVAGPMQEPLRAPVRTLKLITLTPQLGRYFGTDHGVLVARAPAHGPLKLEDGDVILSIGGRAPASSSQAIRILTSYDPGEKIPLVILREHRRIDLMAQLPPPPAGP